MAGLHAQDDIVMKAMRDEMARSMKELTIENLEKPYFIAYRVIDSENASVAASFGALNRSNSNRSRMLTSRCAWAITSWTTPTSSSST